MAILIILLVNFFSDWIIYVLFGDEFIEAASILLIHVWACIFVFLGVASSKWLIAEGLQIYIAINNAIGAILNIILNYFFIQNIGVDGAAWATLISQFTASYLCLVVWNKTRINFIYLSKSILINQLYNIKKFI